MNIDDEAKALAEKLDDAFDDVCEEFLIGLAERQFNDFLAEGGTHEEFSKIEDTIVNSAIKRVHERTLKSKVYVVSAPTSGVF